MRPGRSRYCERCACAGSLKCLLPILDAAALAHPLQPLVEILVDALAFECRANLGLCRFKCGRLWEILAVLVVVGPNFLVRHQDSRPKAIVDELEHVELPE